MKFTLQTVLEMWLNLLEVNVAELCAVDEGGQV